MEVHVCNVLVFVFMVLFIGSGHLTNSTHTIKMCRHSICVSDCTCNTKIQCDTGTEIDIIKVEYRDNTFILPCDNCGWCCYEELEIRTEHKKSIMELCNNQHTCNLESWNPDENWKMRIRYICHASPTVEPNTTSATLSVSTSTMQTTSIQITEPSHETTETTDLSSPRTDTTDSSSPPTGTTDSSSSRTYTTDLSSPPIETTDSSSPQIETTDSSSPPIDTTDYSSSTVDKSSPHSPELSNGSSRIVRTKNGESEDFPVGAAVAIPVSIVVMILVIVGIFCVVSRRSNGMTKGEQKEGNILAMQDMTDNNNPQSSGNREDLQEAHEQEYVDTTSHRGALNLTCDSVEHEYVDTNQGGLNTTDDDEYNTLNTHQSPVQKNPNYDHLHKGSHTTVDETYSHVTDSQTAVPDSTYSHLQDSKSNSSRNLKCNQNNSNNVYNHIKTLSVEDNVYNNIQTNVTHNPTSNLSQTRAEDDYDHTDWNQAVSPKHIASRSDAIKTFDNTNLAEHGDDEYAVVNKKSDKVENNDGNNYFVLDKQSF